MILQRLAQLVRDDGGLLAAALRQEVDAPTPYGDAIASAPRAAGHIADLPLVIEAVREGYLLHYGEPRLMSREDDDLALLAGDRLYALGLERLADAGDLAAVAALADLIALSAQAQAASDARLADAVWAAGCAELGWGSTPDLEQAKDAARAGETDAAERLGSAARHIAGDLALAR
ncbi:hypothetical protein DSM104299_05836 [Baekduia alba]|uniref:hypothetical protein n=1 Tax=Baekduia alba TaxID=2997333 RepID=UPI002340A745|nr:hypothetical protein [Baekduia alba]WCB97064.1 hypothetical protein DSM104299_05836 [Baekduia alba]